MYAATTSVALVGGDVRAVRVEAHVGRQRAVFKLSGLPDVAVREAKDRVRAALASSGVEFPNREVTVNLAPADLPKAGTDYDLPIALGVLGASRDIPPPGGVVAVGELALDGSVRPGASTLGAGVISARDRMPCLVAAEAAGVAAAVPGSDVHGVSSLSEAVGYLRGEKGVAASTPAPPDDARPASPDLAAVRGQSVARRALEIAAAGPHHLMFHGPPGGGKTMMARSLPGILPLLDDQEAVEVALIHAAAGSGRPFSSVPPFRAPHHTSTRAALVGGGSGVPVPGEVSLAHNGTLFLDELAEFPRSHLDSLRQPLEDGMVRISRRGASVAFPSRFQLVAATNPCPCGYLGDGRRPCQCTPHAVERYRRRVSGPLVDRFDLVVGVGRIGEEGGEPEPSDRVARRVAAASEYAAADAGRSWSRPATSLVDRALARSRLTARGADRVRAVARTIADLEAHAEVLEAHVAEALALRTEW